MNKVIVLARWVIIDEDVRVSLMTVEFPWLYEFTGDVGEVMWGVYCATQ